MHINNVSQKTSMQMIAGFLIVSIIYTGVMSAMYFLVSGGDWSISHFWNWVTTSYNSLLADNPEDPWIAWATFIILPAVFYLGLICSIVSRQMALSETSLSLNLKSVDFLPDRIKFNFNKPQYNFVCGYGDINALQAVLKTTISYSKYGSSIVVKEIVLNFKVLNNKQFSISHTPFFSATKFMYKIIDYSRNINNFTYRFEGAGANPDINEKIENYLYKGFKPLITKHLEQKIKLISILIFTIGIMFITGMKDSIADCLKDDSWLLCLPIFAFIAISLVLDIILIINKIKEKNVRGYNG